jgi:3-hydroxypropionyl-CoA synthetase (ADP-forming)
MVNLDFFFAPKSVAVICASSKPEKIGYAVLKNIIDAGFQGEIYPVNRSLDGELLGQKSYKSITDVPSHVDLAVYALSAKYAPQVIEECGQKGVKGVVIISGGFKELGGEKEEIQEKALEIAKKYKIRIIGPNCMGILNPKTKLDTFFQPRYAMRRPNAGKISVLTQSGTFGISILEWLAEENIGVSKFVSYGNKADVDEIDLLQYLQNDEETKIIALYVEGLKYGRHFVEMAKEITKFKPIILLKGGRSPKGKIAAKSHTGTLAGNDEVFEGAMKQSGVVVVDDVDEMIDTIKLLHMQPLPKGNNIAMVTNGVGPCVVAVDRIELANHLKLADLGEDSMKKLKESLPDYCVFSNPLDLTGSAKANWYSIALDILKQDENVDIIMPFFVFQDAPLSETIEELHEIMDKVNENKKTMLCVASGGEFTKKQIERLQSKKIPCIPTSKRAVLALEKISSYARYLRE